MNDSQTAAAHKKPSLLKWFLVGVVLMVLGLALAVWGVIGTVTGAMSVLTDGVQFGAGEEITLTINEPGEAMVLHETSGTYQGESFWGRSTPPSGAQVAVLDPSGTTVSTTTSHNFTHELGNTQRTSIASFDAPVRGDYRIAVVGGPDDEVYFATEHGMGDMFGSVGALMLRIAGGGLLIVIGLIVIIVGIVRRATAK